MLENIAILGSTGSIGTQTLEVIAAYPEKYKVLGLSAGSNINLLVEQIKEFSPKMVSVKNKELADKLKNNIDDKIKILYGKEGLLEIATLHDVDVLVSAVVGSVGLQPTIEAIKCRKKIALANKETLVSGGHIVMDLADKYNVPIVPIDSEHSAIFQCLNGENKDEINKLVITASGGSFRKKSREELKSVTVKDALNHPNWSMGAKITIDSATMMNKGFEVIEAHWLFDMPYSKIDVIVHPESIIHSMVEYNDKAVIAQLGTPDMKIPIQYALSYPYRLKLDSKSLNLKEIGSLNFFEPDYERFPCLKMAYQCGIEGGTLPTVLNAANEVAVEAFLNNKVPFIAIEYLIESALGNHSNINNATLDTILEVDILTRKYVRNLINSKGW